MSMSVISYEFYNNNNKNNNNNNNNNLYTGSPHNESDIQWGPVD